MKGLDLLEMWIGLLFVAIIFALVIKNPTGVKGIGEALATITSKTAGAFGVGSGLAA